jgi:hypothetical protein
MLKMAIKKPLLWAQVELSHYLSLSVFATFIGNPDNTIEHKHRWQRQLGIPWSKHPAMPAFQQLFMRETCLH